MAYFYDEPSHTFNEYLLVQDILQANAFQMMLI